MLCYMAICKAPLTEGYSEELSAWQAGENKSSYEERQMSIECIVAADILSS